MAQRHPIHLLEPVAGERDAFNVPIPAPPIRHAVHATRKEELGREVQLADGTVVSETASTVFMTRWRPDIDTKWRVLDEKDISYDIQATREIGRQHWLEIRALRSAQDGQDA